MPNTPTIASTSDRPANAATITARKRRARPRRSGGASLYVYQTDHEGYYGVKPASDNRNPRLKLFLRTDAKGGFSFTTVKPGSYPDSRIPAHIHFEVAAPGRASKIFEIVFVGDPYVTDRMKTDPAFSIRPIEAGGRVTETIRLR